MHIRKEVRKPFSAEPQSRLKAETRFRRAFSWAETCFRKPNTQS